MKCFIQKCLDLEKYCSGIKNFTLRFDEMRKNYLWVFHFAGGYIKN